MKIEGYYIGLGDKTECGGVVLEGDPSISWDGVIHALEGHLVSCGKDGKAYEIYGGDPTFTNMGRCVAGTLDSVSGCPCRSKLLPSARKATYTKEVSPLARTDRMSGQSAAPTHSRVAAEPQTIKNTPVTAQPIAPPLKTARFGRSFSIIDTETHQPLANRTFIATVEGRETVGITDAQGLAHVTAPEEGLVISVHVPFQSPARVLNELTDKPMADNSFRTGAKAREIKPGQPPVALTINDRAATREAIIRQVRSLGHEFVERWEWKAHVPKKPLKPDWDYSMIALHHAGRRYACGNGANQMLKTQEAQQESRTEPFDDIGYHFGIDCSGVIYEGRDIRYKGSNVLGYNTGVIGVVLLHDLTKPEEGNDWITTIRTGFMNLGKDSTNQIPGPQIDAALSLVKTLSSVFVIKYFGGHKEFPGQKAGEGKICPGHIGMELVKKIRTNTQLLTPPKE